MKNQTKDKWIYLSIALIIVLGSIVYSNSVNGKFIWDDQYLVKDNPYIKNWINIVKIFTVNMGSATTDMSISYRPLQTFTFMIDYSLWELNTKGYHLMNILLHILVALAFWWLTNILFKDKLLSLFAGVLFIVHPIHTEAIAYISGRSDPLATLFILLCLIFYIKYLDLNSKSTYTLMILSCALSLLSKESSLVIPILLLVYHFTFKRRIKFNTFAPLLCIALLYFVLRFRVLKSMPIFISSFDIAFNNLPGFFVATLNYIRLLFLPFNLHMEYGNEFFQFSDYRVITGMFITLSLLIYAFKLRNRNQILTFSVLWFFLALLPVSNIFAPLTFYMSEHYLYLPSMGFFIIIAYGLSYIYKIRKNRVFAISIVMSLLIVSSYATLKQNNYWQDPISFYEKTLKYAPNSLRINNNLGFTYNELREYQKAIKPLKKVIEIDPNYIPAYINLGNTYFNIGKIEEAISLYNKAIKINPHSANPHYNLGIVYDHLNNRKEAIKAYKRAIKVVPHYVKAHNKLAKAYYADKQYDLAIKHNNRVLELGYKVDPEFLRLLELIGDKE